MTHKTFRIGPDAGAGERLDVFLARRIPDFARAQFQRFIDKGFVFVNGERRKPSLKLRAGDTVEAEVEIPEPGPPEGATRDLVNTTFRRAGGRVPDATGPPKVMLLRSVRGSGRPRRPSPGGAAAYSVGAPSRQ